MKITEVFFLPIDAFPCELFCMPKGERFYVKFSDKVVDGTKCEEGSLDVCIDGKCEVRERAYSFTNSAMIGCSSDPKVHAMTEIIE